MLRFSKYYSNGKGYEQVGCHLCKQKNMLLRRFAAPAFLITLLFFGFRVNSQQAKIFVISGYVKDEQSGEALINATVNIPSANVNVQSNAYGFYSVSLPGGNYELVVSYAGYGTLSKQVNLVANVTMDLILDSRAVEMQEVVITGERKLKRTNTVGLGIQQLSAAQIKKIPAFMGEPDILKALLTL